MPHQGVCHCIGIGTSGFKNWILQTSKEEKILVIKHQTKKESQMVLCIFHFQSPWLVSPRNVYTIAFVYLLSFLQDRCSGITLIRFRLYASLYGSGVQNQWGNLRPNLKSQMETSHKTNVSPPEAFYTVGLLKEGLEWFFVNLLCGSQRPFSTFSFPTMCLHKPLKQQRASDHKKTRCGCWNWLLVDSASLLWCIRNEALQETQLGKLPLGLNQHPRERNKGSHGHDLTRASLDQ